MPTDHLLSFSGQCDNYNRKYSTNGATTLSYMNYVEHVAIFI